MSNNTKKGVAKQQKKTGAAVASKPPVAAEPARTVKTTVSAKRPARPGGLGRGLDALISRDATQNAVAPLASAPEAAAAPVAATGAHVIKVQRGMIHASPWQPRRVFDEEALQELAASIREHGIIQPLLCRRSPEGGYELIAGERRLRAAAEAGLDEVPVIVIEAVDRDAAEIALVENLQREDLNVVEEAEGYRSLADDFGMTQADIADRVGKARASVANTMRVLELPDEVKQLLGSGLLSIGHAKVILGLDDEEDRIKMARESVKEGLTVRMLEQRVARRKAAPKQRIVTPDIPEDYLSMLLDKLHHRFGTRVRMSPSVRFANGRRGKGRIELEFVDNEELSRLLELLGIDVNDDF
ncbi:MAG: ParB/RepB/Spo0J family partition protein [Kiritimatiellia bacterium]|jgi:ParB family chromosome partitioning protein